LATIFWKYPSAAVKRFILLKINEGVLPLELLPRINQLNSDVRYGLCAAGYYRCLIPYLFAYLP
jgi:hypothetical protein